MVLVKRGFLNGVYKPCLIIFVLLVEDQGDCQDSWSTQVEFNAEGGQGLIELQRQ